MFPSHCGGGGGGCWDSGWLNFAENSMKINYVDPPLILHTNLCFSVLLFHQIPPANEVWGKVIFSEACVKNSVSWGVPALGGACSGGCLLGWVPALGVLPVGDPPPHPRTATAVGGTHPTGMHSCLSLLVESREATKTNY